MRRSSLLPAALAVLAALPAGAQAPAKAPSAAELLAPAEGAAAKGDRAVLVAFHASWCKWCRRLEGTLARPAVKEVLDRHFVVQWLTVLERGAAKDQENPGAADLYAAWTGGVPSGIPFCAVLDAQGRVKGTSIRAAAPGEKPGNLGYPGAPGEIQAFIALLRDGAPALTAAEAATLQREFEAAAPRP